MSSQQQLQELQKPQDLIEEKILHLRTAKVTETDAAIIFKIGSDIAKAERERDKVIQEIAQLNQQNPTS
jgi:prefoldin subunit 5